MDNHDRKWHSQAIESYHENMYLNEMSTNIEDFND